MLEYFEIHPDVQEAMRESIPVVVMESTIWAQGLPTKEAINALMECCHIIREEDALPVLVALSGGKIRVGIRMDEFSEMLDRGKVQKVNLRDIPTCIQRHGDGTTTVSATVFIAHSLGLPVVATGGIGGVHRNADKTFDVSADLHTLANYPIAVVASGVKSILNIGATLEMMETLGIPVIAYGTDLFPSFYCRTSQFPAPERMDDLEEIAGVVRIRNRLGMKSGVLIANPIPKDYSLSENLMDEVVEKSLLEATDLGITGKGVTPYLLERIHEMTGGATVKANIALIKENSRIGAKLSRMVYY
ncbi:MAG: pseudouridine-5'-phosphate glycosidase [Candidatus Eremiobacteraeota bacterium]|nr:pseudouridine-5'-phosphate glycosidase [Candidatus Eremiobacteraeota bacterium]